MSLEGARLARERRRRVRRLRRRLGRAAQRHALAVAEGRRSRRTARSRSTRCARPTRSRSRRWPRAASTSCSIETIFDTLNAKAAIVAAQEAAPDASALALVHRDRHERPQPFGPDRRGVLDVGRARGAARRRRQLLARREGDAAVRRGPRARRADVRRVPSERRPPERVRHATTSCPADTSRYLREFARDGLVNLVGGCCGTTPDHVRAIVDVTRGLTPRHVPRDAPAPRFSGLEPFEIGPDTGFVMIGERTNVTGSARFRRLVEADDFAGAVDVALEQVRGGANLLDVNMDADLLDSVAGDDDVPQLPRHRAGGRAAADRRRQLALVGARGRAEVPSGQGRRQLDLASRRARRRSSSRRGRSAATARASS